MKILLIPLLALLAGFLASKYDLDVTHTQAVQILKG